MSSAQRLEVAERVLADARSRNVGGARLAELSRRLWITPIQVEMSAGEFEEYLGDAVSRHASASMLKIARSVIGFADHYAACVNGRVSPSFVDVPERVAVEIEMILSDDTALYPLKHHPGAKTKVNVFLRDIFEDMCVRVRCVVAWLLRVRRRAYGVVYNDEASAWALYINATLRNHHYSCYAACMPYSGLKLLSDEVKGMGCMCAPYASDMVELQSLLGRGVAEVDWHDDIDKRLNPTSREGMLAPYTVEQLRPVVKAIIAEERGDVKWPSYDDAFKVRFGTVKGGSHSKAVHASEPNMLPLPDVQLNRRNFSEALVDDPLWSYAPGGLVSRSEKLEHGKSRALYALDSRNYMRFDPLCRAVERSWRNIRAVLRPAQRTVGEDIERRAMKLDRYKIMFDFTDFNSAHTTEAMQLVVETLFDGAEASWVEWCVRSFDNMWLRDVNNIDRKVNGTLMSGHRMTSIINTILNAAYMRLATGDMYDMMYMQHVGDDVLASTSSQYVAATVVERVLQSGLAMSPSKQSFGTVCAEFLRVSFSRSHGIGYLARVCASVVGGNWTTLKRLNMDEYVSSVMQLMWSLAQRSQNRYAAAVLRTTLMRRVGLDDAAASGACDFSVSINGSPLWRDRGGGVRLNVAQRRRGYIDKRGLPRNATRDYIAASSEYKDLRAAGVNKSVLDGVMLEASFSNLADDTVAEVTLEYVDTCEAECTYVRKIGEVIPRRHSENIGSLVALMLPRMTPGQIDSYCRLTGRDVAGFAGASSNRATICGYGTPYQDARFITTVLSQCLRYACQYPVLT